MAQAESRLWWYRALQHLVARALAKHPRGREIRILDAGCGTGGLIQFLRERGYSHIFGFDVSPEALAICRKRQLPVEQGDLREFDIAALPEIPDVIISNDALYFLTVEEQQQFLQRCARALAPGGFLILNLPALKSFQGIHDLSVGIGHRFSPGEVRALLHSAGFRIVQLRYWPFLLSPLIYAARFIQRRRQRHCAAVPIHSDVALPPISLNWVFEMVTRLENAVLPWKPFGSSLFVVAQKTSDFDMNRSSS